MIISPCREEESKPNKKRSGLILCCIDPSWEVERTLGSIGDSIGSDMKSNITTAAMNDQRTRRGRRRSRAGPTAKGVWLPSVALGTRTDRSHSRQTSPSHAKTRAQTRLCAVSARSLKPRRFQYCRTAAGGKRWPRVLVLGVRANASLPTRSRPVIRNWQTAARVGR